MSDEQIKYMVERFLGWRLPKDFNPDAGISFKPHFNEYTDNPMTHEPTGTNLFDFTQAEGMVRYMVDGLPMTTPPDLLAPLRELAEKLRTDENGRFGLDESGNEIYVHSGKDASKFIEALLPALEASIESEIQRIHYGPGTQDEIKYLCEQIKQLEASIENANAKIEELEETIGRMQVEYQAIVEERDAATGNALRAARESIKSVIPKVQLQETERPTIEELEAIINEPDSVEPISIQPDGSVIAGDPKWVQWCVEAIESLTPASLTLRHERELVEAQIEGHNDLCRECYEYRTSDPSLELSQCQRGYELESELTRLTAAIEAAEKEHDEVI